MIIASAAVAVSTTAVVGARIRRARDRAGLSQEELAEMIGRTQTTISLWESGRRSADIDDLVALADALEVEVAFFFEDDRIQQPKRMLLRAQGALRPLDDWADAVEQFEQRVDGLPRLPRNIRVRSETPVRAAEELLAQARITQPPVPINKLAKECGIHVLKAALPDGVSGVLLMSGRNIVIGYNETHHSVRQRFTIAHELGHYLLDHHDHFHIDLSDQGTHGNPPGYNWQDERNANDFAAAVLMPAAMVARFHAPDESVVRLAKRFNVSRQAMGWRLVSLGLLE